MMQNEPKNLEVVKGFWAAYPRPTGNPPGLHASFSLRSNRNYALRVPKPGTTSNPVDNDFLAFNFIVMLSYSRSMVFQGLLYLFTLRLRSRPKAGQAG